jgi:prolyl-tRNA synthetase
MTLVETPTQTTIEDVSTFLKIPAAKTVKTLLVVGKDTPLVALVLRGDHELNLIKAEKLPQIANPVELASNEVITAQIGCNPGFIGPVNLPAAIPVIVDRDAAHLADFTCGANQNGKHLQNANLGRDCPEPITVADIRNVVKGDASPDGVGSLQLTRGIEVGHIFQLGDNYSKSMRAEVLNEDGTHVTLQMGCYGIGVSRIVAAAIEQNNDENGIIWPDAMAPFSVVIVPINLHRSEAVRNVAESLYADLTNAGYEVLLEDRVERPGVMFADMDLIGIPHRIVVSERNLAHGQIEYKNRREAEAKLIDLDKVLGALSS